MPNETNAGYPWSGRWPSPTPAMAANGGSTRSLKEAAGRYDEVDLRLMDTFPASDAVARY